jgi:hypothetical protein
MRLPVDPHEEFGANRCGCLVGIIGEATEYRCNEQFRPERLSRQCRWRLYIGAHGLQSPSDSAGLMRERAGNIEKYLKAILLLRRVEATKPGHSPLKLVAKLEV